MAPRTISGDAKPVRLRFGVLTRKDQSLESLAAPQSHSSSFVGKGLAAGVFLLALGSAIAFNQSAVHWRANVDDDHLFGYYGWRISEGARPYLDVWDNKPPGIWWLNAVGFKIFGPGIGSEILICTVALATAISAFTAIAATLYSTAMIIPAALTACVLLTHIGFECGGNRTETFVLPCEALAVLGYMRWRRRGSLVWLAAGAFAGGAAPLFKQSGLAASIACMLHAGYVHFSRRSAFADSVCVSGTAPNKERSGSDSHRSMSCRAAGLAAFGFLTPATLAAAALWWQGALGEFWFATVTFNRAYFAVHDATWLPFEAACSCYRLVIPPLYGLMFIAALGIGGAVALRLLGGSSRVQGASGLLFSWLLTSVYLSSVGPGRQSYHLMPGLAPLGLLALQALYLLTADRGVIAALVARPTVALAFVGFGYLLCQLLSGSAQLAQQCWSLKPNWYAMSRIKPTDYDLRAAAIQRLTTPNEAIYAWGWTPGTYRFAYRPCVSRFATIEKAGQVGRYARFIPDTAAEDIRLSLPAIFFISVTDYSGMMQAPRDAFADWVKENYFILETIGGMHLMRPKSALQPSAEGPRLSGIPPRLED